MRRGTHKRKQNKKTLLERKKHHEHARALQALSLESIATRIRKCRKCALWRFGKPVPGEGPARAKIFFVGQAPGRQEGLEGRPFVGRAGKFFDKVLAKAGIRRQEAFITSVLKHFPPGNRLPKKRELDACLPYLTAQIQAVNPRVVVLLGRVAERALARNPVLQGRQVIATVHPSAAMRFPRLSAKIVADLKKIQLKTMLA